MEKKIETSKPILNRTRRQLLLGAGLTPVVMTLHSAKVMAQSGLQGGVSGPAPFSGAIVGSANINGGAGNTSTELSLYKAVYVDSATGPIRSYYGEPGSTSFNTPLTETQLNSWSSYTWKTNATTPKLGYSWTANFEQLFKSPIDTYMNTYATDLAKLLVSARTDETEKARSTIGSNRPGAPSGYPDTIGSDYQVGAVKFYYDVKAAIDKVIIDYDALTPLPETSSLEDPEEI